MRGIKGGRRDRGGQTITLKQIIGQCGVYNGAVKGLPFHSTIVCVCGCVCADATCMWRERLLTWGRKVSVRVSACLQGCLAVCEDMREERAKSKVSINKIVLLLPYFSEVVFLYIQR